MVEHWRANGPPVYLSVAAYLGLVKKSSGSEGSSSSETGNLEELEQMFAGSGGMIS